MSYTELVRTLSKQWANVNDIQKIANCGRDNASTIRNNIITKIVKEGKFLPTSKEKIVPMSYVIDYLNLDIKYITDMALMEKIVQP